MTHHTARLSTAADLMANLPPEPWDDRTFLDHLRAWHGARLPVPRPDLDRLIALADRLLTASETQVP